MPFCVLFIPFLKNFFVARNSASKQILIQTAASTIFCVLALNIRFLKLFAPHVNICLASNKKVSQPAVLLKPQENVNEQNTKWLSTGDRRVSACVCACECVDQWRPPTWASRFLHSWVCCWCCCRAALACLSRLLASRWCSWTRLSFSALCCCCSRVLSCSCCMRCSAIWLDKQAKRDFISQHTLRATLSSWQLVHPPIHPSFLRPIPSNPLPPPKNPRVCQAKFGEIGRKVRGGVKKSEKSFAASSRRQRTTWCDVFTSGSLPPPSRLSCQLYRLALHVPLLFLQICPPRLILGSAYKRAASLGYASKLVGVSHLAAATTQCPMLCAWQHVKIGLGNDYDDYYKPKLEKKMEREVKGEGAKIFLVLYYNLWMNLTDRKCAY